MEKNDKQKALDAALAQIEKQYGKGSVMKLGDNGNVMEVEATPTGSISLDIALGIGGIPKGRIIEIYGPESSGKTTLALHCVAEVQRLGGIAGYIGNKDRDPVVNGANCKNSGTVTGKANVGGIVGYLKTDANHDFNHCVNNGNVKSTAERGGGIIGYCCGGGNFTYCTNTAKITAKGKRDQIIAEIEDDKCDLTGCICNGSVAAASILSEGNVWIIGGVALAALIAVLVILLKKKKAGAADKGADESADESTDESVNERADESADESADE